MQIITLLLFCLGAKAFVQIPAPYNNFGWFVDNNNAYTGFYPGGVSPHSMATPFLAYPNAYPYLNYPYTLPYYTYRYGNQQDVPFVPNVVKTVETSGKPQPSPPKVEQPKLADAGEPFSPPSPSRLGKFKTAAVNSDGIPCSQIGRDVLVDGGNAVDAAIATVFCIGAVNPQSAGIGGGFHMTFYDPVGPVAQSLDAREVAPIAATENMFKGNASISQRGGLAVAVP
ncbi:glutathione hydrolase proenzyme-like isoform X2 [Daphnia pulex]|uniref:glutathione hydrolase proenzyme-like isoform X2 n=1 Tax=Daphnia pulex TaxID=6669 RepID=UPI001EDE795B|nr:glutathione hydrolase proenzyme-like isoform X2 [Daphnia pulex]